MGVPSSVSDRIDRLEKARKNVERRRQCDEVDAARRQAVEADRKARRPMLLELSMEIFAWRDSFARSREGARFWNLIGPGARLEIHHGWFWNGLPIDPRNPVRAHTRVSLDGTGHHFLFEEWRDGANGVPVRYQETWRARSPLEMVDAVHPQLIEGLLTQVTGPEAWQPFIDELDRWLDRYVQP